MLSIRVILLGIGKMRFLHTAMRLCFPGVTTDYLETNFVGNHDPKRFFGNIYLAAIVQESRRMFSALKCLDQPLELIFLDNSSQISDITACKCNKRVISHHARCGLVDRDNSDHGPSTSWR